MSYLDVNPEWLATGYGEIESERVPKRPDPDRDLIDFLHLTMILFDESRKEQPDAENVKRIGKFCDFLRDRAESEQDRRFSELGKYCPELAENNDLLLAELTKYWPLFAERIPCYVFALLQQREEERESINTWINYFALVALSVDETVTAHLGHFAV